MEKQLKSYSVKLPGIPETTVEAANPAEAVKAFQKQWNYKKTIHKPRVIELEAVTADGN